MMGKKWAGYAAAFSICMSLLAPAGYGRAADQSVKVTLPKFTVELNGHKVDNEYREYPLLVYRDITYVPMTWYDSRLLGLEAGWSPDDGLNIVQSRVTSSYVPYESRHRNAAAYTAEVPASAVTVNGKTIDNTKEEYPLLSFRDVTYLPLTWRLAHDEFGWDYQWDAVNGLRIASRNPQVHSALPAYAGKNDAAVFRGYYYFVETTGMTNHVYRAPVQQPSDKEEIYAYDFYDSDRAPGAVTFQIRDNALWFTYHLGGGVAGSDYFVKIGDDGKAELKHRGYLNFRETPYGSLIVLQGASAFEGGNLYLSPPGQDGTNRKRVGDPNLMYAVTYDGAWSLGPDSNASYIGVDGDDVYVLASRSETDANHIYKVNLKTNKTEKITDSGVRYFRVIDNKLYYVKNGDNALYSSALDGTGEMKLSDHAVSWFDSIDGNVFYTTRKDKDQYELYQADPNGEDPRVWYEPVADVQTVNGQLVCRLGDQGDYGAVLLDSSGRLLLKVTDSFSRLLPSDTGVLLESQDSSVEFIR